MFIPWDPNLQNNHPTKTHPGPLKKMVGTNKTMSSLSTHMDPAPWILIPPPQKKTSISTCGNLSSICCTSGKGLMRTDVVTWSTYTPPPRTPPNVPNPPEIAGHIHCLLTIIEGLLQPLFLVGGMFGWGAV